MSDKVNAIIKQLQNNGYRITEQRKNLVEVILANECSTCKEIYYKALEKDPMVGIATVYRTVSILEGMGVLNRNNMFDIAYENIPIEKEGQKNATFVCTKCGAVSELDIANIMTVSKEGQKKKQKVLSATIKGICEKCAKEENQKDQNRGDLYHKTHNHLDCARCENSPCKVG